MPRPVSTEDIVVQVETDRTDVWIPEGLAVRKLPYTPDGITLTFDARNGLSLQDTRNEDKYIRFGPFVADDVSGWVSVRPSTYSAATDAPQQLVGPSLVETTVPIPVRPGMQVAMSGTVKVRTSGKVFKSPDNTSENFNDAVGVQTVLFGLKTTTDAYGNSNSVAVSLGRVRTQLQAANSTTITEITFAFGSPGAPSWITVPDGVDRVMFAVELVDLYHEQDNNPRGIDYKITGSVDRYLFRSPRIDSVTDNPIRVHLRDPANIYPTYPHPLSATGWAFRDRARFDNLTPGAVITAMGEPSGPAVTVSVYEWTGSRGPLLATLEIPTGEKVTATLAHTGSIDVAGTGTFYVESVLPPLIDTDTVEQTHTTRYEYATITAEVSSIKTTLREADLSLALVRIVSDTLAQELPSGHRMRIAAITAGGRVPVFAGTIRTRRLVSVPRRRQQIEIGVHDVWARLSDDYPAMFDQLAEYGPALHALGEPVEIDGVDYTGPRGPLPSWYTFAPSFYAAGGTLLDALLASRNTRSAYLFTDRRGRLVLTSTLPDTLALLASDVPGDGEVSYARELEVTTDSASLVNVVTVDEHLTDRDDYLDRRLAARQAPQWTEYPAGLSRSISYRRSESVDAYGPAEQTFPVVRGSGTLADVEAGNFGPPFQWWAGDILDVYATERTEYTRFTIPVETTAQLPVIAALQPFSAVAVRHAGTAQVVRPRTVQHTIDPNGWLCELDMSVRRDQVYWLPPAPAVPDLPVDGGIYSDPGSGTVDGGTPDTPGTGIVDGGALTDPDTEPAEWDLVDNFDRPDEAELGAPWVRGAATSGATIGLLSGAVAPAANNTRARYYHETSLGPFHRVEVTLGDYPPQASSGAGVLVRASAGLDAAGIVAYVSDTDWYVSYFGDGLDATLWASGAHVRAAGDVIRVDIVWHHLTVAINDTVVYERFDLGNITFGEHVGLYARGAATRIESWRAAALDHP